MLRSMTGFGSAEKDAGKFTVKVEIRSLNNKFFELSLRMPRSWQSRELELRSELTKMIERGSVHVNINVNSGKTVDDVQPLNHGVINYYLAELKKVASATGWPESSLINNVFDIPNVILAEENEADDEDWKLIRATIDAAFTEFESFRKKEGLMLETELGTLCNNILGKLAEIEPYENARIENIREKIGKEMKMIRDELQDKNRFEQELIYYLEKLDISEEKTRLKQHCDFFMQTIKQSSTGKKLGFIAQEIGREINTIGSKSNEANMQRKVVEMKDELEKIKEQVNNVL